MFEKELKMKKNANNKRPLRILISGLLVTTLLAEGLFANECFSDSFTSDTYEINESISDTQYQSVIETISENIQHQSATIQESSTGADSPSDNPNAGNAKQMLNIKGKKINRYAYFKKTATVYSVYNKPIKKIKKGTSCTQIKKLKNGLSMIQISHAVYFIKTSQLTYNCPLRKYVNTSDKIYSYGDLIKDISSLCNSYRDILSYDIVGKSADNRNIYSLTIGNPYADKTLFIESTIHAREYTNTQVLMKIIEDICRNYGNKKYYGKYLSDIFREVKLVVMPMVNPDGVSICQYGANSVRDSKLRKKVLKVSKGKYHLWKANARCIDLNRNFAEGFGYKSTKKPAASEYAGKRALSEPEVIAETNTILSLNPNAVICFHEAGQVLYYRYNSKLLSVVKKHTGYLPIQEDEPEYGSASDFLDRRNITNCTIENGISTAPLPHLEFNHIYQKNKYLLIEAAKIYM